MVKQFIKHKYAGSETFTKSAGLDYGLLAVYQYYAGTRFLHLRRQAWMWAG